jgi:hypothetical protein
VSTFLYIAPVVAYVLIAVGVGVEWLAHDDNGGWSSRAQADAFMFGSFWPLALTGLLVMRLVTRFYEWRRDRVLAARTARRKADR